MATDLLFWDVDTQADFMLPGGALYVPGAEAIIPNLRRLTDYAHHAAIRIVASADDHTPADAEISATPDWAATFPPHCMHDTPGQGKIPETALVEPYVVAAEGTNPGIVRQQVTTHDGDVLILKRALDVFSNPNTGAVLKALDPARIVLYGVATDFCDRAAVEGLLARRPGTQLYFVSDAARAIDPARGAALEQEWAAKGVRLVTTDEVLAGGIR